MEVGRLNGLRIEVLTRDEHCPPHVHVDGSHWHARFEFAYWHDDVTIYSLDGKKLPSQRQIDEFCRAIERPAVLRKAREAFWNAVGSVCLNNQRWDFNENRVVNSKNGPRLPKISQGTFHSCTETRDGLVTLIYETRLIFASAYVVLQH